jgi:ABC-type protease/lipase transport system fused ATPase/permease subunit
MVRTSVLATLCATLIGFGVPLACIYFTVFYDFNVIIAGIIAVFALIVAGVLAILGMAIGSEEMPSESLKSSEREKLNLLRAHQRATLEELDDVIDVLKEIRDLLKEAHE